MVTANATATTGDISQQEKETATELERSLGRIFLFALEAPSFGGISGLERAKLLLDIDHLVDFLKELNMQM